MTDADFTIPVLFRITELISFGWHSRFTTAEEGKNRPSLQVCIAPEADLGLDAIIAIDCAEPNVCFCIATGMASGSRTGPVSGNRTVGQGIGPVRSFISLFHKCVVHPPKRSLRDKSSGVDRRQLKLSGGWRGWRERRRSRTAAAAVRVGLVELLRITSRQAGAARRRNQRGAVGRSAGKSRRVAPARWAGRARCAWYNG